MIDQPQRRLDGPGGGHPAAVAAVDHDHGKAERAGGGDLGVGRLAAAVLGDDHVDAMLAQQRDLILDGEGAAGEQVVGGRGERRLDRVDAANEIMMLRGGVEMVGLLPSDREEDAQWRASERDDRLGKRGDARPAIPLDWLPSGALEPDQRRAGRLSGALGIGRNLPGEGVGSVDQKVDAVALKKGSESIGAPEAAGAHRHGLRRRIGGAAGERQRDVEIGPQRQPAREIAGLGGAAQNEDASLVHA